MRLLIFFFLIFCVCKSFALLMVKFDPVESKTRRIPYLLVSDPDLENKKPKGFSCKPSDFIIINKEYRMSKRERRPKTFYKVIAINFYGNPYYRVYNFSKKSRCKDGDKKNLIIYWGMEEQVPPIEFYDCYQKSYNSYLHSMRVLGLLNYIRTVGAFYPRFQDNRIEYVELWGWNRKTRENFFTVLHVWETWQRLEDDVWVKTTLENHLLGPIDTSEVNCTEIYESDNEFSNDSGNESPQDADTESCYSASGLSSIGDSAYGTECENVGVGVSSLDDLSEHDEDLDEPEIDIEETVKRVDSICRYLNKLKSAGDLYFLPGWVNWHNNLN